MFLIVGYLLERCGFTSYFYQCNHSQEIHQQTGASIDRHTHEHSSAKSGWPQTKFLPNFATEIKDGLVIDLKSWNHLPLHDSTPLKNPGALRDASLSATSESARHLSSALNAGAHLYLTGLDKVQTEVFLPNSPSGRTLVCYDILWLV